jgi:hypothetical protein
MQSCAQIKNVVIAKQNPCGQLLGRQDLPAGLITLSKHACFGGAVSFHEHRSETCDATMRFAVYAPPRRVLDPAIAQEMHIATHGLLYHLLLTADARAPDLLQPVLQPG